MKRLIVPAACLALVLAAGCGKGQEAGGGGDKGGAAAPAIKADLSSAKSAFEGFATAAEQMEKTMNEKMTALFSGKESEIYAPVFTKDYSDFIKKREKEFGGFRGDSKKDKMALEKEEPGQGGDTTIFATQKSTRTEKDMDPATRKIVSKTVDKTVKHRLTYTKAGSEWRIKNWDKLCGNCEGKGKCPDCDGTKTTLPKECFMCKGKGKDEAGEKCYACEGSGKTKPEECWACKKTEGKCPSCKGNLWTPEDDFESDSGFLSDSKWNPEAFSDLSSPLNAVKSFASLEDGNNAKNMAVAGELVGKIREVFNAFFVKETQDRLEKAVKTATEANTKQRDSLKRDFKEPKVTGDTAIAWYTETMTRQDKERTDTKAFKLVKKDGSWKIDDRGLPCMGCDCSGKCKECKGTGKTDDGDCYMCQADKGKCSACKGEGFQWQRRTE